MKEIYETQKIEEMCIRDRLNISRKTAKKYATDGFVFTIENTSRHRTDVYKRQAMPNVIKLVKL